MNAQHSNPNTRTYLPHAEKALPNLSEWLREQNITTNNWQQVVSDAKQKFGDNFDLEPLTDWTSIDPISELVAMRGGSNDSNN